jgi:hypothetical protein
MSRTIANALGGTFALLSVVVIGSTVAWSNIVVASGQAYASKAEFEQAFVDANVTRPQNTAPNREKLREIGWKHFNVSVAGK